MKILVIDDSPEIRAARAQELARNRHEAVGAKDYRDAQTEIRNAQKADARFDLILLDMRFEAQRDIQHLNVHGTPIRDRAPREEEIRRQGEFILKFLQKEFGEDLPPVLLYSRTETNYRNAFSGEEVVNYLSADSAHIGQEIFDYLLTEVEHGRGVNIGFRGMLGWDLEPLLVRTLGEQSAFYRSKYAEFTNLFCEFVARKGVRVATVWELRNFEEKHIASLMDPAEFDTEEWRRSLARLLQMEPNSMRHFPPEFPGWAFASQQELTLVLHPAALKEQKSEEELADQKAELEEWVREVNRRLPQIQHCRPESVSASWLRFPQEAPPSFHLEFPVLCYRFAKPDFRSFLPWNIQREKIRKETDFLRPSLQILSGVLHDQLSSRFAKLNENLETRRCSLCHEVSVWLKVDTGSDVLHLAPLVLPVPNFLCRKEFLASAKSRSGREFLSEAGRQYQHLLFQWVKGRGPADVPEGWSKKELESFYDSLRNPNEQEIPCKISDFFDWTPLRREGSVETRNGVLRVYAHRLVARTKYFFPYPVKLRPAFPNAVEFVDCEFEILQEKAGDKDVWLTFDTAKFPGISFDKCRFATNGNGRAGLRLNRCVGNVSVSNCRELPALDISSHMADNIAIENSRIEELRIQGTVCSKLLRIQSNQIEKFEMRKVVVQNQDRPCKIRRLLFNHNDCGTAVFEDSVFKNDKSEFRSAFEEGLTIRRCRFQAPVTPLNPQKAASLFLKEVEAAEIRLKGFDVSGYLSVSNQKGSIGRIEIKGCQCSGPVDLEFRKKLDELSLVDCVLQRPLRIAPASEIGRFQIHSCHIESLKADQVRFDRCVFGDLNAVGMFAFRGTTFRKGLDFSPARVSSDKLEPCPPGTSARRKVVFRSIFRDIADFSDANFGESETKPPTEAKSAAQADTGCAPEAEADSAPELEAQTEAELEAQTEGEPAPETEADSAPGPQGDADTAQQVIIDFSETYFDGRCTFEGAKFHAPVSFENAVFAEADMRGAIFRQNPDFTDALFRQDLQLQRARFESESEARRLVHFDKARIEGTLDMSQAEFGRKDERLFNIPCFLSASIHFITGDIDHRFPDILDEVERTVLAMRREGKEARYKDLEVPKIYDLLSRQARMLEEHCNRKNESDLADLLYVRSRRLDESGSNPSRGFWNRSFELFSRVATSYGTSYKRPLGIGIAIIALMAALAWLCLGLGWNDTVRLALGLFLLESPTAEIPAWFLWTASFGLFLEFLCLNFFIVILARKMLK